MVIFNPIELTTKSKQHTQGLGQFGNGEAETQVPNSGNGMPRQSQPRPECLEILQTVTVN